MTEKLQECLTKDLHLTGIDTDSVTLLVRPFHSRYLGRYLFPERRVYVYQYADRGLTKRRDYRDLLETAIHEGTHHMMNIDGMNAKGLAHGEEFYLRYKKYMDTAKEKGLFRQTLNTIKRRYRGVGLYR